MGRQGQALVTAQAAVQARPLSLISLRQTQWLNRLGSVNGLEASMALSPVVKGDTTLSWLRLILRNSLALSCWLKAQIMALGKATRWLKWLSHHWRHQGPQWPRTVKGASSAGETTGSLLRGRALSQIKANRVLQQTSALCDGGTKGALSTQSAFAVGWILWNPQPQQKGTTAECGQLARQAFYGQPCGSDQLRHSQKPGTVCDVIWADTCYGRTQPHLCERLCLGVGQPALHTMVAL